MRRDASRAVREALRSADPAAMVRRALRIDHGVLEAGEFTQDLRAVRRIVVVGGGKASGLMAAETERILGDRIAEGVVVVPDYQRRLPRLRRVEFAASTHPLPTEKGARATRRMIGAMAGVGRGDLVIALISGGGSALMPSPVEGTDVRDLQLTTELLLRAGAEIGEINCVRKHLSRIAGGRLAAMASGAELLALLISDVSDDDPSSVASGPTVADPTTFGDARRILKARGVWGAAPAHVREVILAGEAGKVPETPKPGDPVFDRVTNVLVGSNAMAVAAAKRSLERAGYVVKSSLAVTGEARVVGKELALAARDWKTTGRRALVWGGETTVTVRGRGVGGRNQEVVLAAAIELEGARDVGVASFGTDGVDGPTEAAGAYADSRTVERARALGLDPARSLRDNDSHAFFSALGDLIITGPTGTNVNDVMMALRA